jgi:methylmalonyl-CoA/ethylmalonyl-CoA epimerase
MAGIVKTEGLNHYAITVENMAETLDWYRDKLGFKLARKFERPDGSMVICHVEAPDFLIEIFSPKEPIPLPSYRLHPDTDLSVQGHKHMSIGVKDGPLAVFRLEKMGVKVVAIKEVNGTYGAFIQDNTGNLIEVFETGIDASDPAMADIKEITVEGINHTALSVSDLDAAVDWYNRVFGFTVIQKNEIPGIGAEVCHMQANGFILEIFQFPGSAPMSADRSDLDKDPLTCGNKHFSLGITDVEAAAAQLGEAGVPITALRELHGKQNIFINDIAGNVIELSEI